MGRSSHELVLHSFVRCCVCESHRDDALERGSDGKEDLRSGYGVVNRALSATCQSTAVGVGVMSERVRGGTAGNGENMNIGCRSKTAASPLEAFLLSFRRSTRDIVIEDRTRPKSERIKPKANSQVKLLAVVPPPECLCHWLSYG